MTADPCPACGSEVGTTPGCRTCPAWIGSRDIRRLGAEVRAQEREGLANELAGLAARLGELAGSPGRARDILPDVDAEHLELLSDHLAACSSAVRDGRPLIWLRAAERATGNAR